MGFRRTRRQHPGAGRAALSDRVTRWPWLTGRRIWMYRRLAVW